jgi:hypothetical protein
MAESILGRYQVAPAREAETPPPEASRSGSIMDRYVISKPESVAPPSETVSRPGTRVARTRFQQSAEPPQPVTPEQPEQTWGETGRKALESLPRSGIEAVKALAAPILSPVQTAKAVGQLGEGLFSKAKGAFGVEQDPKEKEETERLANALGEHYSNIYGGLLRGDTAAFKKALGEDPVSILMDASTLVGGTGLLAKGAGLEKTASALSKVSAATDPVQAALKIAKLPGAAIGKATPYVQAVTSGSSVNALKTAQQAGRTSNPVLRKAFEAHLKGADPMEIVEKSQSALKKLSDARGSEYVANISKAKAAGLPQLPWSSVDNAMKANLKKINFQVTGPTGGAGPQFTMYREAQNVVDEIQKAIDFFKNQPRGSNAHTLEGFDALKRYIGEVQQGARQNPVAYGVATDMYNSVLNTVKTAHPEYAMAMEAYQNASKELTDLRSAFGLGRKGVADESVLRRILSTKDNTTKKTLLDDLAAMEPELPYMLAGQELKEILPGGVKAYVANAGLAPLAFGVNPALVVGQAALASPRVAGKTQELFGKGAKAVEAVTSKPAGTAAYYAGRAQEEEARPIGTTEGSVGMPTEGGFPAVEQKFPPTDEIFGKLLQVESGNSQFDRKGNVITSPAGAIGIAQIMPGTAPEAAKLAGLPYDPQRLRNDPAYNEALGRAYFEEQLKTFGSPVIAAAAYNAGPGAVRRALSAAKESGEHFANFLPDETQNYILEIFGRPASRAGGRIARATGGKIGGSVEGLLNKLMIATEDAKKRSNSKTEDLLEVHDDHIAKALEVADKAI